MYLNPDDYSKDLDRLNLLENHIKIIYARVNDLHNRLEDLEKEVSLFKRI